MRILYTNNTLSQPAGTELAVRDLCLEMRRRGHEVAAFSMQHGKVAEMLKEAGVPVAGRLEEVPFVPDVIHGHHEWETSLAALNWIKCPVISFCRGLEGWQEEPCLAPNVVRWVAVDEPCRGRLLRTAGVEASKVQLVLNGIDLERFRVGTIGEQRPDRALVLSNYATRENFAAEVVEGCRLAGLECEVVGAGVGSAVPDPERLMAGSSVVFAKGKVALEALACGCAVIVCDQRGLGPLVTPENFEVLRRESFGFPCMIDPVTAEGVAGRLAQRNLDNVVAVTQMTQKVAGAGRMFDELEELYCRVREEEVKLDAVELAEFAATFLGEKGIFYKLGREVWNHGVTQNFISGDMASATEVEVGFNRIIDRFRKGLVAINKMRVLDKMANQPSVARSGWRFWRRMKGKDG